MKTFPQEPLTPEEAHVIEDKGTERPFTGEYTDHFAEGTYICRKCGTPLYRSKDKFDSHCGWPSFDDAIPGRVTQTMDADGRRTEITCTTCGGHLGHVFTGERETQKNVRHCVNSLSMKFVPEVVDEPLTETIVMGGGCFWCVEAILRRLKGVIEAISGYSGGTVENPTYEQICSKKTGHIEVVQLMFDPSVISLTQILRVFFSAHNPTTMNRQGHDVGEQYASVIFTTTPEQEKIAHEVIDALNKEGIWSEPIVTKVEPLKKFWPAEGYHQRYYEEGRAFKPYCQAVIDPKIKKLRAEWKDLLKEDA